MKKSLLRPLVFWPAFILAILIVITDLWRPEQFQSGVTAFNHLITHNVMWCFSLLTFSLTLTALWLCFSPLAHVRIGGKDAKPLLSLWKWFSITLTATIAAGLLFWSTAEPLYYLHVPPESLHIAPNSADARIFAMSTLLLHWSYGPYAIYAVPGVVFALVFYNLGKRYSLSSMIEPVLGARATKPLLSQAIDGLALVTLVFGMAATMGTSLLMLSGGIEYFFGSLPIPHAMNLALIAAIMTFTFIFSAISGLQKGIAVLASWNAYLLFGLGILLLIIGPTLWIFGLGVEGLGNYLQNFISKTLFTGTASGDTWPQHWSLYFWAVWMAWAPISALFLGYIARGYTVRQYLLVNWVLPASFTILWMWIFGGTSLLWDIQQDGALYQALNQHGVESVLYTILTQLPLSGLLAAIMLSTAFLSFVTSAHANTTAMAAVCTTGMTPENLNAPKRLMVLWGVLVGFISWAMVSFAGIDGIKIISNLGGVPALVLMVLINMSVFVLARDPRLVGDLQSEQKA